MSLIKNILLCILVSKWVLSKNCWKRWFQIANGMQITFYLLKLIKINQKCFMKNFQDALKGGGEDEDLNFFFFILMPKGGKKPRKIILTSKSHALHLFTGQNTQRITVSNFEVIFFNLSKLWPLILENLTQLNFFGQKEKKRKNTKQGEKMYFTNRRLKFINYMAKFSDT